MKGLPPEERGTAEAEIYAEQSMSRSIQMLLVSIIFNGEGILPEQGVGRGSQEWARRIDTGSVRLLRHMGKKTDHSDF